MQKFLHLLWQSVRAVTAIGWADFVLKYRGSFLGYLWSFLSPFARFIVILYVFGPFVSASIPAYPLYLFLGIILWENFSVTTMSCIQLLFEKMSIIQKVAFPRILLIFATGWTNLVVFLTHFAIFLVFALVFEVRFSWGLLYVFLILLQMSLLALGVGMVLAAYSLKYRDIGHLWGIATQVLFWLTPIMYSYHAEAPLSEALLTIPGRLSASPLIGIFDVFVRFQPLSILIHDARRVTLYPTSIGIPTPYHSVAFTLVCIVIFLVGVVIFQRRSPYFLQEY